MNSTFFSLLLYLSLLSGWHSVRGSVGCSTDSCSAANREPCPEGLNFCGPCLENFKDVNNICIADDPARSNINWDEDLAGTDGSEISTIFDTTTPYKSENSFPSSAATNGNYESPTSAPATGVDDNSQELSPESNQILPKNEKSDGKLSQPQRISHLDGENKRGNKFNSQSSRNNVVSRLKLQKDELDASKKHIPDSQKQRDEEKLNKFLGEKEEKGKMDGEPLDQERRGTNLQVNSSTNPPPYIKKHKVGKNQDRSELDDIYFLFIVIGCSVAGIAGLALAGYCWYKLHTTAKAVSEAEYTGYGMKGSTKQPPQTQGDQKLDYSAEMYHYQQTKSQLAAMEKAGSTSPKGGAIDDDDDDNSDEGDEGDYTVYECPGLAPTGDMTVVNPMFSDQEALGSDQDANGGDRSCHSSPTAPRHAASTPQE